MHHITEHILATSFTKKEALKRLGSLKAFLDFKFFYKNNYQSIKQAMDEYSKVTNEEKTKIDKIDYAWLYTINEQMFLDFKPENIQQVLSEIEQEIVNQKIVIIYLSFDPENYQSTLELSEIANTANSFELRDVPHEIGNWCKANIDKKILMEIKIDPNIIGGCALSINGVYKDYSVRARMVENKDAIIKSLSEFKR